MITPDDLETAAFGACSMNTQSLRIPADTRRSLSKLRRYIEIHEQLRREVEAARMSAEIIGEVERVLAETDFSVRRPCRDEASAGGG